MAGGGLSGSAGDRGNLLEMQNGQALGTTGVGSHAPRPKGRGQEELLLEPGLLRCLGRWDPAGDSVMVLEAPRRGLARSLQVPVLEELGATPEFPCRTELQWKELGTALGESRSA